MNKLESVPIFGTLVATISAYNLDEWASILGILFGFVTVFTHVYYKKREFALKKLELEYRYGNEKKFK